MGSALSAWHLHSLICYCDLSALSTAFSATFRKRNKFESVSSLKRRHSAFAHFARLLVEAVQDFGVRDNSDKRDHGPFWCGLSVVLNIGSYAIYLKGPCSTSKQRAVATNFAKRGGIILKMMNPSTSYIPHFDCSWLSNYWEEDERLWVATEQRLQIESILIVENANNYRKFIEALYYFDDTLHE